MLLNQTLPIEKSPPSFDYHYYNGAAGLFRSRCEYGAVPFAVMVQPLSHNRLTMPSFGRADDSSPGVEQLMTGDAGQEAAIGRT